MNRPFLAGIPMLMLAVSALAIDIDGTADTEYGSDVAVQDTQTGFGDSNLAMVDWANGSELDVAKTHVNGGIFYMILCGNLESNYNKLEIFFDCIDGGQNKLRGDNPDVDYNGLNRMGDDGSGNGLTFDADFYADFWVGVTGGDDGTAQYALYANYAELLTEGGGEGYWLGKGGAVTDGTLVDGNNPYGILVTINNINVAGVTGGTGPDDGSGVITGVEMAIPLEAIGSPTGDMKVCAFVNGYGHDWVSNQVLAGIGTGDNLGEPRNVNLQNIEGNQYFVHEVACVGDLDGDGDTDQADLAILLADWEVDSGSGDLNGDGDTDQADLGILLANWGCGT
jgi:hypothetical protein